MIYNILVLILVLWLFQFLFSGIKMLRNIKQDDLWAAPIYFVIAIARILGSIAVLAVIAYLFVTNLLEPH